MDWSGLGHPSSITAPLQPLLNVTPGPMLASSHMAITHRPGLEASCELPEPSDSQAGGPRRNSSHSHGGLTIGWCEERGTVVVIQRYGLPAGRAATVSSSCPQSELEERQGCTGTSTALLHHAGGQHPATYT